MSSFNPWRERTSFTGGIAYDTVVKLPGPSLFDFFTMLYEFEKSWRSSPLLTLGVFICCPLTCILSRGKEWKTFSLDELREALLPWDFFLLGIHESLAAIAGDFIFGTGKVFSISITCIKKSSKNLLKCFRYGKKKKNNEKVKSGW